MKSNLKSVVDPKEVTAYNKLRAASNVVVKIPNQNPYFRSVPEMGDMKAHWKFGMPLSGVILNCHYYGIEEQDFGKKILADVTVKVKIMGDGRKYTLLDITKISNDRKGVEYDLKIQNTPEMESEKVAGAKTDTFICFCPRKKSYQQTEETQK